MAPMQVGVFEVCVFDDPLFGDARVLHPHVSASDCDLAAAALIDAGRHRGSLGSPARSEFREEVGHVVLDRLFGENSPTCTSVTTSLRRRSYVVLDASWTAPLIASARTVAGSENRSTFARQIRSIAFGPGHLFVIHRSKKVGFRPRSRLARAECHDGPDRVWHVPA